MIKEKSYLKFFMSLTCFIFISPAFASIDKDEDGVEDSQDICPNTEIYFSVDSKGCPIIPKFSNEKSSQSKFVDTDIHAGERNVVEVMIDTSQLNWANSSVVEGDQVIGFSPLFSTGKTTLSKEQLQSFLTVVKPFIDHFKKMHLIEPSLVLMISAYTDAVGCQEDNLKLTWERTAYLKHQLVEHFHLSENVVFLVGFGEFNPIASNLTKAGRKKNRRVVLSILSALELPNEASLDLPPELKHYQRKVGKCPLPDDQ